MEWLYYLIVCVISVCLGLVIIDFDYRKKSKWIIPIIAITIGVYGVTWQFRPLEFDEIVKLSNDIPISYEVHLTNYNNGFYSNCSINSDSLESDQVRKEIWQDIRGYFIYTDYRLDIHSVLPWKNADLKKTENNAGDVVSITLSSNDGKNEYLITIVFEEAYVIVSDENASKQRIYHYLGNEVIHKMDDYIQEFCALQALGS